MAKDEVSLLKPCGSFSVGDAVEDSLSLVSISNYAAYWMVGRQAILCVSSILVLLQKGGPSLRVILFEFDELGLGVIGHESSERLVEPQVIPPFHGHKVAEPHVAQLVKIRVAEFRQFSQCLALSSEQVSFIVSYAADVFHRATEKLRAKYLIVLVEWIPATEKICVELDARLCCEEHVLVINVGHHRLAGVDAHWRHSIDIFLEVAVGPGDDRVKVSRDLGRLVEPEHFRVLDRFDEFVTL